MSAKRLNGKTADVYYHAVPPPDSNPDPSNNWSTKLQDVWNEHGFVEQLNFPAREVQFIWHVLASASTVDIEKHFQNFLNRHKSTVSR